MSLRISSFRRETRYKLDRKIDGRSGTEAPSSLVKKYVNTHWGHIFGTAFKREEEQSIPNLTSRGSRDHRTVYNETWFGK